MYFTLSPNDFFLGGGFLPLSLLHKYPLVKTYYYEFNNSINFPITSSLLEFNLFVTLLLNSLNIYTFLNTCNQISNTNKQHVKL